MEITGRKREREREKARQNWILRSRDRDLRFYAKTQMGRAFQYPDVSVYNRWTLDDSIPSFPLSPRSIPDTSNFAVSTTLVDSPRPPSTASFSLYFVHFLFSRTMLVKRKNRPRVYCRYLTRKYALTLATIVRRMVRERSPSRSVRVNDKIQVSSKTESNCCRICNCNKRIS